MALRDGRCRPVLVAIDPLDDVVGLEVGRGQEGPVPQVGPDYSPITTDVFRTSRGTSGR